MHFVRLVALSLFSLSFAACGDSAAAGAPTPPPKPSLTERAKELANKAVDANGLRQTFTDLTRTLKSVGDGPTAQRAKGKVEELVGTLKQQLNGRTVEDHASSLGTLGSGWVAETKELLTKLVAKPEVQQVLGPAIEELKSLVGK